MKTRRGLSSVVGMVFAIIAMATTIAYVTHSLDVLEKFSESILARNQQTVDAGKENFKISSVTISKNRFNITISNTGNLPINFTKIWVQNTTDTDWVRSYVPANNFVGPGATLKNVGQSIPLSVLTTQAYHIKLVTSRGTIQEFNVNSANIAPLDIKLYAFPPNIASTFTTELVMSVTNNQSSTLVNLVPAQLQEDNGLASYSLSQVSPSSYNTLPPGGTAFFKWDLTLSGNSDDTRLFIAQLQNAYPGNTASVLTKVTVVPVSLQSGTSIQSLGLSTTLAPQSELILHKETSSTPNNAYQLWNGSPEGGAATSINTSANPTNTWFTNNDTSITVDVDPGSWKISLRYISDKVPTGFSAADLIYHFEANTNPSKDSSGNGDDLTVTGAQNPLNGNGVNNTNAYNFVGSSQQYMSRGVDSHSNISTNPATSSTALWVKTSGSVTTKQVLVRMGDGTGASKSFYEVSILNHKLFFQFSNEKNTGAVDAACTGTKTIDDQKWHHVVAEKTGAGACQLYVDGSQDGSQTTSTSGCSGTNCGTVTGNWSVGRDSTNPASSYFSGTIDDLIHWNSAQLTSTQVSTLALKTSYGASAHKMSFTLEKTKQDGTSYSTPVYVKDPPDTNYQYPFYDAISGSAWNKNFNYTTGQLSGITFNGGERLKLVIAWQSGLNMTIRLDDNTLSNPITSFLQTPSTDNSYPGYLTYTIGTNPSLYLTNNGPNSSWVSFLTRLSYEDLASTGAFGSMINTANGTGVTPYADGPLFKVNQVQNLVFWPPTNPPCSKTQGNSCLVGTYIPITQGHYRLYAFLSGYDQLGNIFLRTIYIGPVNVTP